MGRPESGGHLQGLRPTSTGIPGNRPVARCGGTLSGSFIHSLVVADICTGWTEAIPLLPREQYLVVEGLDSIARQLPFPVLGIDSDHDSAFINDQLVQYRAQNGPPV